MGEGMSRDRAVSAGGCGSRRVARANCGPASSSILLVRGAMRGGGRAAAVAAEEAQGRAIAAVPCPSSLCRKRRLRLQPAAASAR